MFTICVKYSEGDSGGTRKDERNIEYVWTNLEILVENLERIVGHYEWYMSVDGVGWKEPRERPPYVSEKYDSSLYLKMDDGAEQLYSAFWCGYFETLISARAVLNLPEVSPVLRW
ncbi:MAG TPA: hypothetical protein PLP33_25410 [Leptospiraceae bacterium]|nr:hypothetical protein [Leptospiraceae bacterium]